MSCPICMQSITNKCSLDVIIVFVFLVLKNGVIKKIIVLFVDRV